MYFMIRVHLEEFINNLFELIYNLFDLIFLHKYFDKYCKRLEELLKIVFDPLKAIFII